MSGSIPIFLKWGKASYDGRLSIEPGTPARGLKLRVQSLTGVPVVRQKLLCPKAWKGPLQDGDILPDNMAIARVKDRVVVTLIGSAECLTEKPMEERPRFEEDMTAEELWKARRSGGEGGAEEDVVDIVALQKEPGMERDDGKMEMYEYDRIVTGLPQHQIDDMLGRRKVKTGHDASEANILLPLLGEVAMTMGMELRRAYINSLTVLPNGTLVSGLDDGHVQLWRRGKMVRDARHPGSRVDHVLAFPPSATGGPSFVTAGDGSICLWTEGGDQLMRLGSYLGTTPSSIEAGGAGEAHGAAYLAASFRVTREADPNQFRLAPQNEAERRRRRAAEAREREIQHGLLRASRCVKIWFYSRGVAGGPGAVTEDVITPDAQVETAPIVELLDMNGSLVCGDAWGGIRTFQFAESSGSNGTRSVSRRQRSLLQLRGCSIACMELVGENVMAVSTEPNQHAGVLASAAPLHASSPHGIYIVDMGGGTIKAVLDAHVDTVRCICLLPDDSGRMMSAGGRMDATVRVWDSLASIVSSDPSDEAKVYTDAAIMKQPGYVFDLKVLPDSRGSNAYAIAAARYNVIKILI